MEAAGQGLHRGVGGALIRRIAVAVLAAAAIVVGGAGAPAVARDEGTIVALVNQARADGGLHGLVPNPSLDAVAAAWAQQLAARGALSHNPSVGDEIPGGWTSWGENVAQGYGSGAAMHDGWMGSPGHRANILGDFTDIGVALIDGGGTTWGVEVFASYPGSGGAPPPVVEEAAAAPVTEEAAAVAPPAASETVAAPTTSPTPTPTPRAVATATASPVPRAADAVPTADDTRTDGWAAGIVAVAMALAVGLLILPATSPFRRRRRTGGRRASG